MACLAVDVAERRRERAELAEKASTILGVFCDFCVVRRVTRY
jgi:hypothetical protein